MGVLTSKFSFTVSLYGSEAALIWNFYTAGKCEECVASFKLDPLLSICTCLAAVLLSHQSFLKKVLHHHSPLGWHVTLASEGNNKLL